MVLRVPRARIARVRSAISLLVVALVSVVIATAVVAMRRDADGMATARRWLDDDKRWTTALASGETMAAITQKLLDAIRDAGCDSRGEIETRCRGG